MRLTVLPPLGTELEPHAMLDPRGRKCSVEGHTVRYLGTQEYSWTLR